MFRVSVTYENAFNAVPFVSSFTPDLLHCLLLFISSYFNGIRPDFLWSYHMKVNSLMAEVNKYIKINKRNHDCEAREH
jgi:hypothetical protein